jgi:uracil-DNA glycosylase
MSQQDSKESKLLELARKRKAATPPVGYFNIGEFHNGRYECEYIFPWSISAHNVHAGVVLLAQDWASSDVLNGEQSKEVVRLGYNPELPTNKKLFDLLQRHLGLKFSDTYAMDVFPFVKEGGMSVRIPMCHLVEAAREYALPAIKIIEPKIVICVGFASFLALGKVCQQKLPRTLSECIDSSFSIGRSTVHVVAHTGSMGTNARRRKSPDQIDKDWAALKKCIL